ncbi:hypothetical protein [Leptothermofonsia sp. ETS-13]|uniref:hypothetical protein n=1 Tax=Leptothermofonsia sp. ETS-13 TaxID=3035696 RepID=UPI003B9E3FCE
MNILVENLFRDQDCRKLPIPSFFVKSTAPSNVEDDSPNIKDEDQPTIHNIVELLYQNAKSGVKDSGLVIAIHGYNTGTDLATDGVREFWYKPLSTYINQDPLIQKKEAGSIFLGYRWPSESLQKKTIRKEARKALPILLSILLYGGIFATILFLVLAGLTHSPIAVALMIISVISFSVVLTLYLLRISVYFRDAYRASIYGVSDLVELIRQIDQGLIEKTVSETLSDQALYERINSRIPEIQAIAPSDVMDSFSAIRNTLSRYPDLNIDSEDFRFQQFFKRLRKDVSPEIGNELLKQILERLVLIESLELDAAQRYWQNHLIKLSFIGHSMGGHVTTQVIRILSDVFDPRSVGRLGEDHISKTPSSRLGRVFRLGRLILVAPDIPLLTITSGRTNFLRSALRRFEEAYLFSNEGDLALRIASTAANYFSFPARSRTQGYRLGNLTVTSKRITLSKSKKVKPIYGIVNLEELPDPTSHLLPYLEVNVLSKDQNQRLDPASQWQERKKSDEAVASVQEDKESIADLFTYFDCTEYRDRLEPQGKESYVLLLDGQRSPLKFLGYLRLFMAFATGKRDVHGGYFQGPFAKLLIYRLAFIGFQGLLDSLPQTAPETLGISTPLPEDLSAELMKIQTSSSPGTPDEVSSKTPLLDEPSYQTPLQKKRLVALQYFSWVCAQKQIQVAISPERYQVDILGRYREDVREYILLQKAEWASIPQAPTANDYVG